ncbi:MAG: sporulation protein [Streptosporangiales bacterium]|nr:sporulation protein [Streptosporangiales bacterium]
MFDRLSSRLGGSATVQAVYGEPIERGGVVIIPVARVSIGFGGGGGQGRSKTGESGEGAGGGGGASATPIGYIEIRDGNAQFKPIRDPLTDVLVPVGALLAGTSVAKLIRTLLKRRR